MNKKLQNIVDNLQKANVKVKLVDNSARRKYIGKYYGFNNRSYSCSGN